MRFTSFPFFRQLDSTECGPTCLRIIAAHYGRTISIDRIRHGTNLTREGVTMYGLSEASDNIGLRSTALRATFESLRHLIRIPCIVHWKNTHFVVVYRISSKTVSVSDPAHGLLEYSIVDFIRGWIGPDVDIAEAEGLVLSLEPTADFFRGDSDSAGRFGFGFLLPYFNPYARYIGQVLLGLAFVSILQLIFPFLAQSVVDYGITYQDLHFVTLVLVAQLTLFFSQAAVEAIRGWILLHVTSRININLISDFLLKLMRLPMSFFNSRNTGDIMQRIYDHNRVGALLSSSTLGTLFSIVNVIAFGIVLAYYSIEVFLIFFACSVTYVFWTILFLRKRADLDYKRFNQSARNQSSLFQLISAMQEIKLNGSERRRRWDWEAIQVQLFKVSINGLAVSQAQNIGGGILIHLQNILVTFFAVKGVISGDMTLGMMISVQYIIGQMTGPINNLIGFIQIAQDAKLSLERLSEVHNRVDERKPEEEIVHALPVTRNIRIRNLSFRYGDSGSPLVLDDVDLEIPENKVTAIVGASGSGKTTLLKLLLRFYEPEAGSIFVGDLNLNSLSFRAWRGACGVVMQDGYIFDDTVARNITEGDSERPQDTERLLRAVSVANLNDFVDQSRAGLSTRIGSSGLNISGGQRQRILIARAVYKDSHYIFFDEATSSLDAQNERRIIENLREFSLGRTMIIVAHRLSTVRNADQIVVLDKGKVSEQGTHDQLVEKRGQYFNLIKNQLEIGN